MRGRNNCGFHNHYQVINQNLYFDSVYQKMVDELLTKILENSQQIFKFSEEKGHALKRKDFWQRKPYA